MRKFFALFIFCFLVTQVSFAATADIPVLVSGPDHFLKASDLGDYVEFKFNKPVDQQVAFSGPGRMEISGNTIKVHSPGNGVTGTCYLQFTKGFMYEGQRHFHVIVGVAGDYATLQPIDFLGNGEVLFNVHVQCAPEDVTPVVGRKVSIEVQVQGSSGGGVISEGRFEGMPLTVATAGEGITDSRGDANILVKFYKDAGNVKIKAVRGFDPLVGENGKHRLVADVAGEGQAIVHQAWQTWQAGEGVNPENHNLSEMFMSRPFELTYLPWAPPGGVSNHVDITQEFLDEVFSQPEAAPIAAPTEPAPVTPEPAPAAPAPEPAPKPAGPAPELEPAPAEPAAEPAPAIEPVPAEPVPAGPAPEPASSGPTPVAVTPQAQKIPTEEVVLLCAALAAMTTGVFILLMPFLRAPVRVQFAPQQDQLTIQRDSSGPAAAVKVLLAITTDESVKKYVYLLKKDERLTVPVEATAGWTRAQIFVPGHRNKGHPTILIRGDV